MQVKYRFSQPQFFNTSNTFFVAFCMIHHHSNLTLTKSQIRRHEGNCFDLLTICTCHCAALVYWEELQDAQEAEEVGLEPAAKE